MSLVVPATACLLVLGPLGAIIIAQWTQWSPDCKIWNHSTSMHNWRYWQQSVWNYGLYCASAEVSGFLVYQLHIKGIVPYYWSSLTCIENWILICYMGLKFPHGAVFLHVLESDGACTGLNGHCASNSAVLVLVCCYKARGDREQDLWRYWLPEGCIKQQYDRASGYGCLNKKYEMGEQCSIDLAVSCILTKHCDIQSENTRFKTLWLSPLPTIHIDIADSCVLPLPFLRSLSNLSGCLIINIRSCHQDRKLSWVGPVEYHPNTGFQFHYCKPVT